MPSSITSALSSLGNSGALKDATSLASLGGTAYNLYNQFQQQQYQNRLRDLAQNPAKLNAYAQQFVKPLNAGLERGVANQAQAYLAERGLSDSPQITQQVEAQAIAPYIEQNQQAGYQNALAALGLGGGAIPPAYQQEFGLDQLTKGLAGLAGLAHPSDPSTPSLADYLRTFGSLPPQIDQSQWSYPAAGEPGYTDWGGAGGTTPAFPDLSAFYTPDYSAAS